MSLFEGQLTELLYEQLHLLDYETILSLSVASPRVRQLCRDGWFWIEKTRREFPEFVNDLSFDPRTTYRLLETRESLRASRENRVDVVRYLLDSGETITTEMFESAVQGDSADVLSLLLLETGKINPTRPPEARIRVQPALALAIKLKRERALEQFVAFGVPVSHDTRDLLLFYSELEQLRQYTDERTLGHLRRVLISYFEESCSERRRQIEAAASFLLDHRRFGPHITSMAAVILDRVDVVQQMRPFIETVPVMDFIWREGSEQMVRFAARRTYIWERLAERLSDERLRLLISFGARLCLETLTQTRVYLGEESLFLLYVRAGPENHNRAVAALSLASIDEQLKEKTVAALKREELTIDTEGVEAEMRAIGVTAPHVM